MVQSAPTRPQDLDSLRAAAQAFARDEMRPVALQYDESEDYPLDVLRRAAELGLTCYDLPAEYGGGGVESLRDRCEVIEELAWGDSPIFWVIAQGGFFAGPLLALGSEEQKLRWLPPMARFERIGSFGLTEPEVGSGTARGLTTTARREGDTWILDGQKKWIGNATFADVNVIWARDVADDQVKGFVLDEGIPGFTAR